MKTLDLYIAEALVKNHITVDNNCVNLGLPSGNLWSIYNLGANKPEEYGNYYMWGSTEDNSNDECCWKNAPFNDGKDYYYGEDTWEVNKDKAVDKNGILLPENDAATVELGKGLCIPTQEDFDELIKETTNEWTDLNGVHGVLLTSKKNNNTLFIPAAGRRRDDANEDQEHYGYFWSSTLDAKHCHSAFSLNFSNRDIDTYMNTRREGYTIRPVYKR